MTIHLQSIFLSKPCWHVYEEGQWFSWRQIMNITLKTGHYASSNTPCNIAKITTLQRVIMRCWQRLLRSKDVCYLETDIEIINPTFHWLQFSLFCNQSSVSTSTYRDHFLYSLKFVAYVFPALHNRGVNLCTGNIAYTSLSSCYLKQILMFSSKGTCI